MVHVEPITVKGEKYFRLVHNVRKGDKITHTTKYIGKELPSSEKMEELKISFLQEINRKKIGKDTPELQRIKTIVLPLLQKEKIIKAGVFGSYARGEQTKRSDIDILIQYRRNSRKSLLNVVQLERKVGEALGKKVDIITYDELSPYLRQRILHDEVSIL